MGDDFNYRSGTFLEVLFGVIAYLVHHPDAKDTPAGIRRLWRPPTAPEWPAAELEEVLEDLAARDWLVVRGAGQERLYGANPQGLAEMTKCLAAYGRHTKE